MPRAQLPCRAPTPWLCQLAEVGLYILRMPKAGLTELSSSRCDLSRLVLHQGESINFNQAHPWFQGIDWENIRRYPAPFRPELQHPEDTHHFDGDIPAEVNHIA